VDTLRKYIEEVNKDLHIDDFNLKTTQMKLPTRKHFWVARLIDAKVEKGKLLSKKKQHKKELVSRIIAESPVKITTQTAEAAAENTTDIENINEKLKELDYIIEYLEKVEKIFSSMHWEIKNIVQINQMEQL
jgi:DNA-dependent RNA polymerase auxiliary subunit epsilon